MAVNERLKEVRKYYKLSQQAFADRLGIKRGVLTNLEYNLVEFTDITIKAICSEFNINENWFRTGEGSMFKDKDYQAIENLSKTHNLDDLDRKILYEYITLPPEMRAAFKQYLLNLANSVNDDIVQLIARGDEIESDEKLSDSKKEDVKNAPRDDNIP